MPRTVHSRRERPAKPALSRAAVVGAAVRVLKTEGLDKVTMRRIATELDTGAASLYVYVRSTRALHAEVLDALLGEVDLKPRSRKGSWKERLIQVLDSYTRVLHAHPTLAMSAVSARPSGEAYLRLLETLATLLAEGRVPTARAAWGVDLLLQLATATAAEQSARDHNADAAADDEALRSRILGLSRRTHPHLTALGTELFAGPGELRLRWAFQVLLAGIEKTPSRPHARSD